MLKYDPFSPMKGATSAKVVSFVCTGGVCVVQSFRFLCTMLWMMSFRHFLPLGIVFSVLAGSDYPIQAFLQLELHFILYFKFMVKINNTVYR